MTIKDCEKELDNSHTSRTAEDEDELFIDDDDDDDCSSIGSADENDRVHDIRKRDRCMCLWRLSWILFIASLCTILGYSTKLFLEEQAALTADQSSPAATAAPTTVVLAKKPKDSKHVDVTMSPATAKTSESVPKTTTTSATTRTKTAPPVISISAASNTVTPLNRKPVYDKYRPAYPTQTPKVSTTIPSSTNTNKIKSHVAVAKTIQPKVTYNGSSINKPSVSKYHTTTPKNEGNNAVLSKPTYSNNIKSNMWTLPSGPPHYQPHPLHPPTQVAYGLTGTTTSAPKTTTTTNNNNNLRGSSNTNVPITSTTVTTTTATAAPKQEEKEDDETKTNFIWTFWNKIFGKNDGHN